MVTVKCMGTGLPSRVAGRYFHWRNASMAACCKSAGPETTFIADTCPFASISASTRTSPSTCWFFASAGYTGDTELSMRAALTSPPTGSGAVGAAGCLVFPATNAPLSASEVGDAWLSIRGAALASPASGVLALRVKVGVAKRTWPMLGFLRAGSASCLYASSSELVFVAAFTDIAWGVGAADCAFACAGVATVATEERELGWGVVGAVALFCCPS